MVFFIFETSETIYHILIASVRISQASLPGREELPSRHLICIHILLRMSYYNKSIFLLEDNRRLARVVDSMQKVRSALALHPASARTMRAFLAVVQHVSPKDSCSFVLRPFFLCSLIVRLFDCLRMHTHRKRRVSLKKDACSPSQMLWRVGSDSRCPGLRVERCQRRARRQMYRYASDQRAILAASRPKGRAQCNRNALYGGN